MVRFDRLSGRVVPGDQSPRRALADLSQEDLPGARIVGLIHQIPYLSVWVAEARKCTQLFRVGQRQAGTFDDFGLLLIRFAAGGFSAVEMRASMRAVAERLLRAMSAATECIRSLRGKRLPRDPFE